MKQTLAEIIAQKKQQAVQATEQFKEMKEDSKEFNRTRVTEGSKLTIAQIIAAKKAGITDTTGTKILKSMIQQGLDIGLPKEQSLSEQVITVTEALKPLDKVLEGELLLKEEKNDTFSLDIELNDQQILARDLALSGKSFVYIGTAGTGKTTGLREIARSLLQSDSLRTHNFRVQGTILRVDAPSIAIVAWTRIASGNARRAIHKDPILEQALAHNVTTLHNLLEYYPEFFISDVTGQETMRFVPKRTAYNKLDITHLIIEEASLVDLTIWEKLYDALQYGVQIIFVGDINQLPPVFGPSILNFALTQLPTVELTHVYRQKGDSLVLENAHNILAGRNLVEGKGFKIVRCGDVQHGQAKLSLSLGQTFPKWMEAGEYDPEQDIILSPWNKKDLGTDTINCWIAQKLGTMRNAVVHQIIAGRTTLHLAAGDKVMYNKMVATIKAIHINVAYMGKKPLTASNSLSRFGVYVGVHSESDDFELAGYEGLDIDKMLEEDIDITKQCSHHVVIETVDGIEYVLESIGDFSPSSFSLGYALTVHKAQGCEWRKVFLVMHRDHSITLSREFIYTAVTRAREECVIIAKEHLINQTIARQRLKGQTLAEKIEYFNSGLLNKDDIKCTK